MGVGGYNVNPSISQHALGPMFRSGSENAQYGAGGHLHPSSRLYQATQQLIVTIGPRHTFWVGQDWHVSGCKQIKKEAVDVRWKEMMRRLDEDVPAVVDAKSES